MTALAPPVPVIFFPSSVKVGWQDYAIADWSVCDAMASSRHGETQHIGAVIRISFATGNRQAAATLLHEIMHAIANIWRTTDDDKEERIVQMIEHGLATVWRDNPQVFAWIHQELTA